ncbi:MAG: MmcQ/YjbR family DNA-binding protein [Pseudomonadota bacterium]
MTQDEFHSFCASLPHTTHVVQWGDADVWKIGGKFFAALSLGPHDRESGSRPRHVTFKVSDMAWEIYREADGVRPAPYLASRGLKWLQRTDDRTISDDDLRSLIEESYRLVAAKLTKKSQRKLGLIE